MKTYLLTHNNVLPEWHVHSELTSTKAIKTWVSPFPYTVIILSELTLSELSAVLQTHFQGVWFILVELSATTTNGWLPSHFWKYVNDPQAAWSDHFFGEIAKLLPPKPPPGPPTSPDLKALIEQILPKDKKGD